MFSHKDFQWVKRVFMGNKMQKKFNIEKDYGFRLIIHNRDWPAGVSKTNNIINAINKSRRVIFILSRY